MPRPELTKSGLGSPIVSQKSLSFCSPVAWLMYPSGLPVFGFTSALLSPQSMSSQNALRALTFSFLRLLGVSNLATPKKTLRFCLTNFSATRQLLAL
jgi:hypothetical protein